MATRIVTVTEAPDSSANRILTGNLKTTNTLFSDVKNPTRSLLTEFYPKKPAPSEQEVREMGATVLDHTQVIWNKSKALRALCSSAADNPMRFGCSIFTLGTGLARIYTGDLIGGGMATALGATEIYQQCTSGPDSTLLQMLSDIHADVDMIKSLEEGQQQSLNIVEMNLEYAKRDVTLLYEKLDEIKDLNLATIGHMNVDKQAAYAKGLAAKEAYREALISFSEVKGFFSKSKARYNETAQFFLAIQQIAKSEDKNTSLEEKIEALVRVAGKAAETCAEGKKELDAAEQAFGNAMAALAKASIFKDGALQEITKVIQSAEDALKAGAEKAQYTKECKERITEASTELKVMKERSDDVMRLLSEMSSDVKKAKAEAKKKFDPSDVVVGVGAGIIAAPLGTVSALAIGMTAAYAWHNGTTITATGSKIYNYFFGMPLPPPQPMGKDEHIRVALDQKSSGYYGWIRGRSSYTLGHVDIKLADNEYVQYRFDLNRAEYPISKEDLFTLYSRMHEKLKDRSMQPHQCKAILSQLQQVDIGRGGLHFSVHGLIKPQQAAYGLVNALVKYCDKLEASAA
jgi:hypothetical protein